MRVITETNEQLGVLNTREAVQIARERGYDLILVAPNAQPPVCRIMDYGKFKYEKSKRDKKPKSSANELKMVRLHPRTGPHDRDILVRHAERFLREGHKVRVVCQFKGRENAYPELGRNQMEAIAKSLDEISAVEGPINKQGRDMTMMIAPKPGIKPLVKIVKSQTKNQTKIAEMEALEAKQAAEDAAFAAEQAKLAQEAIDEAIEAGEDPAAINPAAYDETEDDADEGADEETELDGDTDIVEIGDAEVDAPGETDDLSSNAAVEEGDTAAKTV